MYTNFKNTLNSQIAYAAVDNGLDRIEYDILEHSFGNHSFEEHSLLIKLESEKDFSLISKEKNLIRLAIYQTLETMLREGILSHIESAPVSIDHLNFVYTLYQTGVEDDDYRTILTVHEGDFHILLNLYEPYF